MKDEITKEDALKLDELLKTLDSSSKFEADPEKMTESEYALLVVYSKHLNECGFIDTAYIQDFTIMICGLSPEGKAFLDRGGFTGYIKKENENKKIELQKRNSITKKDIITWMLYAIGLIISYYVGTLKCG